MGRGHRKKTTLVTLKNFIVHSVDSKPQADLNETVVYPISNQDDVHRFSETHRAYVAAIITTL